VIGLSVEEERLEQLIKNIPDIWSYETVLYIGARAKRFHFKNQLKSHGGIVDIIEINKERCKSLRKFKWLNKIIQGNVINVDKLTESKYDLILWSHGPQMIEKRYIKPTIEKLLKKTNKLIVLMCPWGKYAYSNAQLRKLPSYSINKTVLYEKYFHDMDFETSTIGKKDVRKSNLLAWKRV